MGFLLGKIFIHDMQMLIVTHIRIQRVYTKPDIMQMKGKMHFQYICMSGKRRRINHIP